MKYFFTLILSVCTVLASESDAIRVEILEKIFGGLSLKEEIIVWSDNEDILKYFTQKEHYKTVEYCIDANFIVLEFTSQMSVECLKKNIFVLNYNLLKELPQSFGALFWKKGRPNIILVEPRIKSSKIKVSQDLEPYMEAQIW